MQYSFSADPTLSERLFDLIDTVFPGLRQVAHNAQSTGCPVGIGLNTVPYL